MPTHRMHILRWLGKSRLALAAAMVIAGASAAAASVLTTASGSVLGTTPAEAEENPFTFSPQARDALRVLWTHSIAAHAERVACIGGHSLNGIAYITRVQELTSAADSFNVSATVSLRQCAPPDWDGTVHTHIALNNGRPYIVFSGADRTIMSMWRRQYHNEGVFCILYSSWQANCEAGYDISGMTAYAPQPGNTILP
jgi:hypothetical protein